MSFKYFSTWLKMALVSLMVVLTLCLPFPASAAEPSTVSVSAPASPVNPGAQFTVNIDIQPASAIAGGQFNLSFDPSLVSVDSIKEGNLFEQNGANTYFIPGTSDNATGSISGVVDFIITPGQTVSGPGTFAVITLTARSAAGICPLTLSDVILGDINGQAVPVTISNGQVEIGGTTPSPSPVISDGGGLGGGLTGALSGGGSSSGGGGSASDRQYLSQYMTTQPGVFDRETALKAYDGICNLIIPAGTSAKTAEGWALSYITISPLSGGQQDLPAPPGGAVIGHVYSLGPEGTTFNPAVTIRMLYDPSLVPSGVNPGNLVIGFWDAASQSWTPLSNCLVDTVSHTVTAPLSHFSTYAVLAFQPETATTSAGGALVPTTTAFVPGGPAAAAPSVAPGNTPAGTTQPASPAPAAVPGTTGAAVSPSSNSTPSTTPASAPAASTFRLSLLLEMIGAAFVLVIATAGMILLRRRRL